MGRQKIRLLVILLGMVALLLAGTALARRGGIPVCVTHLNACTADLGMCTGDLNTCNDDLSTCEGDLVLCEATQLVFPGDGVTGAPLAYEECADGLTVADLNTGLLWEKKVAGGTFTCDLTNLHFVDDRCSWSDATGDWINAVNAEAYAGFSDWRVPNVKELQSIVGYSTSFPSIHPNFGATASFDYWSATSNAIAVDIGWIVHFSNGFLTNAFKSDASSVRAVRTGSCSDP